MTDSMKDGTSGIRWPDQQDPTAPVEVTVDPSDGWSDVAVGKVVGLTRWTEATAQSERRPGPSSDCKN